MAEGGRRKAEGGRRKADIASNLRLRISGAVEAASRHPSAFCLLQPLPFHHRARLGHEQIARFLAEQRDEILHPCPAVALVVRRDRTSPAAAAWKARVPAASRRQRIVRRQPPSERQNRPTNASACSSVSFAVTRYMPVCRPSVSRNGVVASRPRLKRLPRPQPRRDKTSPAPAATPPRPARPAASRGAGSARFSADGTRPRRRTARARRRPRGRGAAPVRPAAGRRRRGGAIRGRTVGHRRRRGFGRCSIRAMFMRARTGSGSIAASRLFDDDVRETAPPCRWRSRNKATARAGGADFA